MARKYKGATEKPWGQEPRPSPATLNGWLQMAAAVAVQANRDLQSPDPLRSLDALCWWLSPDPAVFLDVLDFAVDDPFLVILEGLANGEKRRGSSRRTAAGGA